MTVDYIVSSLPLLRFDEPPQITWLQFLSIVGEDFSLPEKWNDIETQLRNALAEVRGDVSSAREVKGCSLYWKNRIVQCYSEKDILRRQDALDKVWWDAAGELIDLVSPLGKGALFAYAVRLKIALNRSNISTQLGSLILEKCLKEDSK